jgi:phosphatidylglycerol---prolipoprotein diacylglyceryl transferase
MYPSIQFGSLVLWSYGLMMGIGLSLGFLFGEADFRRRGVPIPMGIFLPVLAVSGLVGAKLDDAIVRQWHTLGLNPLALDWRAIWWGGYTWFGGVIGGLAGSVVLAKMSRVPALTVLDVAPVASLGLACGRMGCFLAGDGDYGIPTSLPWGMSFPHGLVPTAARVHPTPLYEIAFALVIFAVLWRRGRPESYKLLAPGSLLAAYLFWTGVCRFLVEFLSRNARVFAGLTEAQLVGIGFILCAGLIRCYQDFPGGFYVADRDTKLTQSTPS